MALKITAVTVYALLTATLALLKGLKVDSRGRGAVKMITAAMFVSVGIYGCVTNGEEYGFVLVIGLAFAFFWRFVFGIYEQTRVVYFGRYQLQLRKFDVYGLCRFAFRLSVVGAGALCAAVFCKRSLSGKKGLRFRQLRGVSQCLYSVGNTLRLHGLGITVQERGR